MFKGEYVNDVEFGNYLNLFLDLTRFGFGGFGLVSPRWETFSFHIAENIFNAQV